MIFPYFTKVYAQFCTVTCNENTSTTKQKNWRKEWQKMKYHLCRSITATEIFLYYWMIPKAECLHCSRMLPVSKLLNCCWMLPEPQLFHWCWKLAEPKLLLCCWTTPSPKLFHCCWAFLEPSSIATDNKKIGCYLNPSSFTDAGCCPSLTSFTTLGKSRFELPHSWWALQDLSSALTPAMVLNSSWAKFFHWCWMPYELLDCC